VSDSGDPEVVVRGSWQQLGSGLYREDTVRIGCFSNCKRALNWGLRVGWDSVELGGIQHRICPYLTTEVTLNIGHKTRVVWSGHVSAAPFWQAERRWRRWLLLESQLASTAVAMAIERTTTEAPIFQLAMTIDLTKRSGLGLRADPAAGVFGFTTCWLQGNWLLRSSHLGHHELGITHRWSLTIGKAGVVW